MTPQEQSAVRRANRKLAKVNKRIKVIRHSSPIPARFVLVEVGDCMCGDPIAGWPDIADMEDGIEQYIIKSDPFKKIQCLICFKDIKERDDLNYTTIQEPICNRCFEKY